MKTKITITDNSICFMCPIKFKEFPQMYLSFLASTDADKETMKIEKEGAKLMKTDFADIGLVNEFVKNVLIWGGNSSNRVRGMLYKDQNEIEVARVVGEAAAFLRKDDLESAIDKITELKGLSVSYGSKILRMLPPRQAEVYDSEREEVFSYPVKAVGYAEFCADCGKVAVKLEKCDIEHPCRKDGAWFVADVEAVIYHKLHSNKDHPKKNA